MLQWTENVSEDHDEPDLESSLSDDDELTEKQPADKPSSESSPATNYRY